MDRVDAPKLLRGALVGYGVIAHGHFLGYRSRPCFSIDVIVDICAARREAAKAEFPHARVYADLRDALRAEQLHFVDICTPPSSHLEHMLLALEHGMLALCEKPLLMRAADVSPLMAAIEASADSVVYACHNYRFAPSILAMKAALSAICDAPVGGHFRIVRTGHARGVEDWNCDWRRDPLISGGGILRDHGPHAIYLAEHFMAAPVSAVACELQWPRSGPWSTTEDVAHLDLYFDDVVVQVDLSWAGTARHTSYRIDTDGGSVQLNTDELTVTLRGGATRSVLPSEFDDPSHGAWFVALLDDVLARRNDTEAMTQLLGDAVRTIRVIDAAYESAATGAAVVQVEPQGWTRALGDRTAAKEPTSALGSRPQCRHVAG